jgi:Ragulator complex protein LAMTOR5
MAATECKIIDALCNDESGFCLEARGSLDSRTSGVYTSLVRLASQLEGQIEGVPLITIESGKGNIMVKEFDGHAVAVRIPSKESDK